MFIAALFTTAKTWKQLKCSSVDGWIKKVCYIYTMEYYSPVKKGEILTFCHGIDGPESIMLSEISQSLKGKYHMISLICGIE